MELKVVERTAELARERQRAETLLLHILPPAIAEELKTNGACEPKRHEGSQRAVHRSGGLHAHGSVHFAAACGERIERHLHRLRWHRGRVWTGKINTVGDAYMAAAGVPHAVPDHAARAVRAALAMQACIAHRNEHAKVKWQLRAGETAARWWPAWWWQHQYAYGIWGDTVNVASRMESHLEPGRVNISATTRTGVKGIYTTQYRGKLEAKGKGEIDMYFVTGTGGSEPRELWLPGIRHLRPHFCIARRATARRRYAYRSFDEKTAVHRAACADGFFPKLPCRTHDAVVAAPRQPRRTTGQRSHQQPPGQHRNTLPAA